MRCFRFSCFLFLRKRNLRRLVYISFALRWLIGCFYCSWAIVQGRINECECLLMVLSRTNCYMLHGVTTCYITTSAHLASVVRRAVRGRLPPQDRFLGVCFPAISLHDTVTLVTRLAALGNAAYGCVRHHEHFAVSPLCRHTLSLLRSKPSGRWWPKYWKLVLLSQSTIGADSYYDAESHSHLSQLCAVKVIMLCYRPCTLRATWK